MAAIKSVALALFAPALVQVKAELNVTQVSACVSTTTAKKCYFGAQGPAGLGFLPLGNLTSSDLVSCGRFQMDCSILTALSQLNGGPVSFNNVTFPLGKSILVNAKTCPPGQPVTFYVPAPAGPDGAVHCGDILNSLGGGLIQNLLVCGEDNCNVDVGYPPAGYSPTPDPFGYCNGPANTAPVQVNADLKVTQVSACVSTTTAKKCYFGAQGPASLGFLPLGNLTSSDLVSCGRFQMDCSILTALSQLNGGPVSFNNVTFPLGKSILVNAKTCPPGQPVTFYVPAPAGPDGAVRCGDILNSLGGGLIQNMLVCGADNCNVDVGYPPAGYSPTPDPFGYCLADTATSSTTTPLPKTTTPVLLSVLVVVAAVGWLLLTVGFLCLCAKCREKAASKPAHAADGSADYLLPEGA